MEKIRVCLKSNFEIDRTFDDEKFMRVRFNAMTTEDNYYEFKFTEASLRDSEDSWKNAAVLANVIEIVDENGEVTLDYGGHDKHIEEDVFWDGQNPDEQNRIIYDERVVGIIPETNDFEVVKRGDYYDIYLTGYIYRDYGNYVADILEQRGGEVDVSSELIFDDLVQSRDPETKKSIITVQSFRATGITLLGKHKTPAMPNAKAVNFSQEVNEIMQELKQVLDNTVQTEKSEKKGGKKELAIKKIEDDSAPVVVEDNTTEQNGAETESANSNETENSEVETSETNTDSDQNNNATSETDTDSEQNNDAPSEAVDFSVVKGKHKFDVSLSDVERMIVKKVDETYSDENTWSWSEVFVDPKYVVIHETKYDTNADKAEHNTYKQYYDVTDGVVVLLGERVVVHAAWLTDEEQKTIDEMRNNYDSIVDRLAQFEAEPKKMEILTSGDYAMCFDTDEFKSLLEQKNHFNLSVEEVTSKANDILLSCAKNMTFESITANENPKVGMKAIAPHVSIHKNYGSLLDGIN